MPSQQRPKTFHPFPRLPYEIRHQIWSRALLSPLTSLPLTQKTTTPPVPPLLHIIPFSTQPTNPAYESAITNIDAHLHTLHGPRWRTDPLAEHLQSRAAEACATALAQYRASRTTVWIAPRSRRGDGSAGGAAGMGAYDARWKVKEEVESVGSVCKEGGRVLEGLVGRIGEVETWVQVGLTGGNGCCFLDVAAVDGSGMEGGNEVWVGGRRHWHPRLVPSLSSGDALRLERIQIGAGEKGRMMVKSVLEALPATVHCEVLASVWSPRMCMEFLRPDRELPWQCVEFKKDMVGLLSRHPKLHTLYLVDPSVQPRGLRVPHESVLKFRGNAASFYEIDPYAPGEGWLDTTPQEGHLNVQEGHLNVVRWARELNLLLHQAKQKSEPTRSIQVKVLACVPDLSTRAFRGVLESILHAPVRMEGLYLELGLAFWVLLAAIALMGLGRENLD
ncbi:hypothetical protein C8A00DRAFT_36942 [Chaetomidium leptoderma]|uniref:2EXR domain-containing protein n=1 Tax=Chaetomidium leptoderma TaxID=669021 RepID=A0AAN6ZUD6_9PEZI|nr:hypothetical protein C8A00DRAFT_36942 [Chaetomidium leptoderma]